MNRRRDRGPAAWTKFAVLLVELAGCRRAISLPPAELPTIGTFHETHDLVVHDGEHEVHVTDDERPRLDLVLNRPSDHWQGLFSDGLDRATWSLEEVSIDCRRGAPHPNANLTPECTARGRSARRVESLRLRPRGVSSQVGDRIFTRRPQWIFAWTAEYVPTDWLALEVGTLPAPEVLAGFAGLRLRGPRISLARLFLGASASSFVVFDPGTGNRNDSSWVGPRFGTELTLPAEHVAFTLEVDLFHPLNGNREFVTGRSGQWAPWGGGTFWYTF